MIVSPAMEEARESKKKRSLAATTSSTAGGGVGLTDDLVVEILSRVPVRSMCRFKCVSPSWRDLISHPGNRKKLPQTLSGFFYLDKSDSFRFVSLAEPLEAASPCGFLPVNTGGVVLDCCNGLVLLNNGSSGSEHQAGASYVVCNPATKKWTTVPESAHGDMLCSASILCFDPAVSAHSFHVVELLEREYGEDDWQLPDDALNSLLFKGFNIYSSETGAWAYHPHSHWSPFPIPAHRRCYFNGLLHFITDLNGAVAALDRKGRTRRVIPVPRGRDFGVVGHSQGRLFYANRDARWPFFKLSIYVLGEEEKGNGRWILKHCVDTAELLLEQAEEHEYVQSGQVRAAAIHPHCNSVFLFDSLNGRLMSYSMDSKTSRVIHSAVESHWWSFVPYVPLYLETSALENSN